MLRKNGDTWEVWSDGNDPRRITVEGNWPAAKRRAMAEGCALTEGAPIPAPAPVFISGAAELATNRVAARRIDVTARTVGASRQIFRPEDRSEGFFERPCTGRPAVKPEIPTDQWGNPLDGEEAE